MENNKIVRELVEILNMNKTTYFNYEKGNREIPFNVAIKLAEYYNVSLDYIAGLKRKKVLLNPDE